MSARTNPCAGRKLIRNFRRGKVLALLREAERRGIRVLHGHLDGRNGVYYHELDLIILDYSLSPFEERFTLAHELGHAHFGHRSSEPANEVKADEYAAKLVISHDDYAAAEIICDSPAFIAQELGVSLRAVEAYCRTQARGEGARRVALGNKT